jgi:hypothetical protein
MLPANPWTVLKKSGDSLLLNYNAETELSPRHYAATDYRLAGGTTRNLYVEKSAESTVRIIESDSDRVSPTI